MMMTDMKDGFENKCLLCSSSAGVGLDSFGSFELLGKGRGGGSSSGPCPRSLSSNLWSHFVLTRVLNIPKEECHRLLGRLEGRGPGEWFSICHPSSCSRLVRQVFELHQKIVECQAEIGGLVKAAEKRILECSSSPDTKGRRGVRKRRTVDDDVIITARDHIRNFVRDRSAKQSIMVDFHPPGEMATEDNKDMKVVKVEVPETNHEDCFDEDDDNEPLPIWNTCQLPPAEEPSQPKRRRGRPPKLNPQKLESSTFEHLEKATIAHELQLREKSEEDRGVSANEADDRDDPPFVPSAETDDTDDEQSQSDSESVESEVKVMPKRDDKDDNVERKSGGHPGRKFRKLKERLKVTLDESLMEKFGVNKRIQIIRKVERGITSSPTTTQPVPPPGSECDLCGEYYSQEEMEAHLNSHIRAKSSTCHICNFPSKSVESLPGHMKRMHEDRRNFSWECDKCDFITILDYRKVQHEKQHKIDECLIKMKGGRGKYKYKCKLCGSDCSNKYANAVAHLELEHSSHVGVGGATQRKVKGSKKHNGQGKQKRERQQHRTTKLKNGKKGSSSSSEQEVVEGGHHVPPAEGGNGNAEDEAAGRNSRFPGPGGRCQICDDWFGIDDMEAHLQKHEKYKASTCSTCKYPFKSQESLKGHMSRVHLRKARNYLFKCSKCEFVTRIPTRRPLHILGHKIEDNLSEEGPSCWKCRLCQEGFTTRHQVRVHLHGSHGAELGLRQFQCSDCGKAYATHSGLALHVRVHHTQVRPRFVCAICGGSYLSKFGLGQHTRVFHSEEKRGEPLVLCDICGKSFRDRHGMRIHRRNHFPETRRNRENAGKCVYCPFNGGHAQAVVMHMRSSHAELYTERCNLCDASYITMNGLLQHKKRAHTANC